MICMIRKYPIDCRKSWSIEPGTVLAAEAMRLEGTRRWVTGSQEGFRELLKALDEAPACCSSVCESCTGDGE